MISYLLPQHSLLQSIQPYRYRYYCVVKGEGVGDGGGGGGDAHHGAVADRARAQALDRYLQIDR